MQHQTDNEAALRRLSHNLVACGERVVFELLADLVRGRDLSETLADFSRIDPATYAALLAAMPKWGRA
ncbi:hypothetical protein [Methylocystis echinoides]|uniref:hypothetical protein n=1 Tax=Methylocystis echinoides TaxID=29468 RepID=UPI003424B18B